MKVLIITGGVITPKENSVINFLRKQISQWNASQLPWLELKIKSVIAEPLLYINFHKKQVLKRTRNLPLKTFLEHNENFEVPELTEVALTSLLSKEGIDFALATYDDVFRGSAKIQASLADCEVVFASSTFLRDLSELEPILKLLKKPHNKLILGGALAGALPKSWQGHPSIDIVAVGYGEYLVPPICQWIKSSYQTLAAPPTGRLEHKQHSAFMYSGVPQTLSLDFIERPDWKAAETHHNTNFKMIYYESVRGCPYRCAFCNYPFLFDDKKFRMKSAQKMANDWEAYTRELQIEYITCLDSLFTMPKARLIEFCRELIKRQVKVKWICYARADDLCDEQAVELLVAAGCIQVQIGIESGDPGQLHRMNKRTTPEINSRALVNCRKFGLTTVATLIVGYPGETAATIETTFRFLQASPPDFFFIATFSTRVQGVPVLSEVSRQEFSLVTANNLYTISPYWAHATMNCHEASGWSHYLHEKLIQESVSLDAAAFYKSILLFDPALRDELLSLQARAQEKAWWIRKLFTCFNYSVDFFFKKDLTRALPAPPVPPAPAVSA
jgi:anaerobic magnesium-protoporphyrin IX monomethyl ester cyclase